LPSSQEKKPSCYLLANKLMRLMLSFGYNNSKFLSIDHPSPIQKSGSCAK
jgi:hypothetical protein